MTLDRAVVTLPHQFADCALIGCCPPQVEQHLARRLCHRLRRADQPRCKRCRVNNLRRGTQKWGTTMSRTSARVTAATGLSPMIGKTCFSKPRRQTGLCRLRVPALAAYLGDDLVDATEGGTLFPGGLQPGITAGASNPAVVRGRSRRRRRSPGTGAGPGPGAPGDTRESRKERSRDFQGRDKCASKRTKQPDPQQGAPTRHRSRRQTVQSARHHDDESEKRRDVASAPASTGTKSREKRSDRARARARDTPSRRSGSGGPNRSHESIPSLSSRRLKGAVPLAVRIVAAGRSASVPGAAAERRLDDMGRRRDARGGRLPGAETRRAIEASDVDNRVAGGAKSKGGWEGCLGGPLGL